jgi:hypothetical protein
MDILLMIMVYSMGLSWDFVRPYNKHIQMHTRIYVYIYNYILYYTSMYYIVMLNESLRMLS